MKRLSFLLLLPLILFSSGAFAQTDTAQMLKDWERAKAYTKEYLDAMPEDGYNYKPTPEIRSFAEQMLHLADANFGFAAMTSGKPSPIGQGAAEKSTDKSKAATTKMVMDSYDFVMNTIRGMTAAQLEEKMKFAQWEMTKATAINKCFEHQTHHRGQTTVYIRLKGAKPPQEKLF